MWNINMFSVLFNLIYVFFKKKLIIFILLLTVNIINLNFMY